MAKDDDAIRFSVGSADGPRSAIWRVWIDAGGSVYIAERYTAGRLKASLHPQGRWRIAFKNPDEAQRLMGKGPDADRAFEKFGPSRELTPGVRRVYTVLIPWLSVTQPLHGRVTEGIVHWFPQLPLHYVEEVTLFLLEPGAGVNLRAKGVSGSVVWHRMLPNGSELFVVNLRRAATSAESAAWTKAQHDLSRTEEVRKGASPDADMRADLIGECPEDGSRFVVDLLIPPPPKDTDGGGCGDA
jgi:hypothetical protein